LEKVFEFLNQNRNFISTCLGHLVLSKMTKFYGDIEITTRLNDVSKQSRIQRIKEVRECERNFAVERSADFRKYIDERKQLKYEAKVKQKKEELLKRKAEKLKELEYSLLKTGEAHRLAKEAMEKTEEERKSRERRTYSEKQKAHERHMEAMKSVQEKKKQEKEKQFQLLYLKNLQEQNRKEEREDAHLYAEHKGVREGKSHCGSRSPSPTPRSYRYQRSLTPRSAEYVHERFPTEIHPIIIRHSPSSVTDGFNDAKTIGTITNNAVIQEKVTLKKSWKHIMEELQRKQVIKTREKQAIIHHRQQKGAKFLEEELHLLSIVDKSRNRIKESHQIETIEEEGGNRYDVNNDFERMFMNTMVRDPHRHHHHPHRGSGNMDRSLSKERASYSESTTTKNSTSSPDSSFSEDDLVMNRTTSNLRNKPDQSYPPQRKGRQQSYSSEEERSEREEEQEEDEELLRDYKQQFVSSKQEKRLEPLTPSPLAYVHPPPLSAPLPPSHHGLKESQIEREESNAIGKLIEEEKKRKMEYDRHKAQERHREAMKILHQQKTIVPQQPELERKSDHVNEKMELVPIPLETSDKMPKKHASSLPPSQPKPAVAETTVKAGDKVSLRKEQQQSTSKHDRTSVKEFKKQAKREASSSSKIPATILPSSPEFNDSSTNLSSERDNSSSVSFIPQEPVVSSPPFGPPSTAFDRHDDTTEQFINKHAASSSLPPLPPSSTVPSVSLPTIKQQLHPSSHYPFESTLSLNSSNEDENNGDEDSDSHRSFAEQLTSHIMEEIDSEVFASSQNMIKKGESVNKISALSLAPAVSSSSGLQQIITLFDKSSDEGSSEGRKDGSLSSSSVSTNSSNLSHLSTPISNPRYPLNASRTFDFPNFNASNNYRKPVISPSSSKASSRSSNDGSLSSPVQSLHTPSSFGSSSLSQANQNIHSSAQSSFLSVDVANKVLSNQNQNRMNEINNDILEMKQRLLSAVPYPSSFAASSSSHNLSNQLLSTVAHPVEREEREELSDDDESSSHRMDSFLASSGDSSLLSEEIHKYASSSYAASTMQQSQLAHSRFLSSTSSLPTIPFSQLIAPSTLQQRALDSPSSSRSSSVNLDDTMSTGSLKSSSVSNTDSKVQKQQEEEESFLHSSSSSSFSLLLKQKDTVSGVPSKVAAISLQQALSLSSSPTSSHSSSPSASVLVQRAMSISNNYLLSDEDEEENDRVFQERKQIYQQKAHEKSSLFLSSSLAATGFNQHSISGLSSQLLPLTGRSSPSSTSSSEIRIANSRNESDQEVRGEQSLRTASFDSSDNDDDDISGLRNSSSLFLSGVGGGHSLSLRQSATSQLNSTFMISSTDSSGGQGFSFNDLSEDSLISK
jgi:hypothetical protein